MTIGTSSLGGYFREPSEEKTDEHSGNGRRSGWRLKEKKTMRIGEGDEKRSGVDRRLYKRRDARKLRKKRDATEKIRAERSPELTPCCLLDRNAMK